MITREEIKHIKQLQKSAKERRLHNAYVVEGLRSVREVPEEDLEGLYLSDSYGAQLNETEKAALPALAQYVKDSILAEMSDTKTPQGILAVVRKHKYSEEDLLSGDRAPLLLLLENLQDPGNLGTILRTAEGAGANGILLCGQTVDIYNPKVVRASMGAIHRVPYLVYADTRDAIAWLKAKNIRCYAAHLQGEDFYREDLTGAVCFFIGNEGNGLTCETAEKAEVRIRIPMEGRVESLNAAAAATVLCYESYRQRKIQNP